MATPNVTPIKETMRQKIKRLAAEQQASLDPTKKAPAEEIPPPPDAPEIIIPNISDIIADRRYRLEMARNVTRYGELGREIKTLTDTRKPIGDTLKKNISDLGVAKAIAGDWRWSYYTQSRSSIKEDKLIQALLVRGVTPAVIEGILKDAMVTSSSYTLRVTPVGEEEGEE